MSTDSRSAAAGTIPSAPLPPATVHVDLDGVREIYEGHGWGYSHDDDPAFETGMRSFLDFFAANRIKATLFVIARSVHDPRRRPLLDEAVKAGHEIASHSLTHRYLTEITTAEKRVEIGQSRDVLQQALGVPVVGFRAAGYRIDRESLDLLAEYGYEWDSSAFPTATYVNALSSSIETLREPHEPVVGSGLVEWPMPEFRPYPIPFNPSYSLVLGAWLFRGGVRRFRRTGRGLSLLFHLIDLSERLPANRLRGFKSKIFTLSTLSAAEKWTRCQAMLDEVRANYRFLMTRDAIAEWRDARDARLAGGSFQASNLDGVRARSA